MTSSLLSPQASVARECSSWHRAKVVCRVGEASPLLSPTLLVRASFLSTEFKPTAEIDLRASRQKQFHCCRQSRFRRAEVFLMALAPCTAETTGVAQVQETSSESPFNFPAWRNTFVLCGDGRPARVRTLQDKAERLMATTGQLLRGCDANYHPPGIAGKVAGKSSHTQWAFPTAPDEIWRGPSPARPLLCAHNGRRCRHTLASLSSQRFHYRVPAFASLLKFRRDRRGSPQVLQVYFAAMWYRLDVAAPGSR